MPGAATLVDALAPLRATPERSAVLLDVDGTLAPIVRHPDDAHVPEPTRTALIAVARRFGLVACVSGRRALTARQIVGLGAIAYVGNHGGEVLRPGSARPELDPEAAAYVERVRAFSRAALTDELRRLRVRAEDKDAIAAFHWRGAPDEQAAEQALGELARRAEDAGLAVHWGRKVLEVRPPVAIDKGRGVTRLLRGAGVDAALYCGDDLTDVDAFRALRAEQAAGRLDEAVCVGVASDETPGEVRREADVMVDGPRGVRELLTALL
ncbi:MAG TPA: trehalose-phosphatase [Solirubrobacteraceae bacterium]|nr:trehalose-phosphatase [Solirubrobacteraceae bacterium]